MIQRINFILFQIIHSFQIKQQREYIDIVYFFKEIVCALNWDDDSLVNKWVKHKKNPWSLG